MGFVNGEEIEMGIKFGNPNIKNIPPQRHLTYLEYSGVHNLKPFHISLERTRMNDIRDCFKDRKMDLPTVEGNWDLMNIWIDNMWTALYNPIKLLKHKQRKWAIIDGCHRLRLLDAMDADIVWFYEYTYAYGPGDWRVSDSSLPSDIKEILRKNNRIPRKGTISGICNSCSTITNWSRPNMKKISKEVQYCVKCGAENPYPYPGRL